MNTYINKSIKEVQFIFKQPLNILFFISAITVILTVVLCEFGTITNIEKILVIFFITTERAYSILNIDKKLLTVNLTYLFIAVVCSVILLY